MAKFGFSLIEVMVVVVIVGIISSLAYPAYQQHVLRSYRAEAATVLLTLANKQSQLLLDYGEYSDDLTVLGITAGVTDSGRYRLSVILSANNLGYELQLNAQGAQRRDTECLRFSLNQYGQRNTGLTEPLTCWL